jgi:HAD superfamily hydrolase (TIGR01662 family)
MKEKTMKKLVIFDADGTLTPQRAGPTGPFEPRLLPGVAEKCAKLRAAGVALAVASNQLQRRDPNDLLGQIEWTKRALGIARFNFETDEARQKPSPAMLRELMEVFGVCVADTMFVGDQETDKQAAEAAGVDFAWASDFFAQSAAEAAAD